MLHHGSKSEALSSAVPAFKGSLTTPNMTLTGLQLNWLLTVTCSWRVKNHNHAKKTTPFLVQSTPGTFPVELPPVYSRSSIPRYIPGRASPGTFPVEPSPGTFPVEHSPGTFPVEHSPPRSLSLVLPASGFAECPLTRY